jgi:hypothetical protein
MGAGAVKKKQAEARLKELEEQESFAVIEFAELWEENPDIRLSFVQAQMEQARKEIKFEASMAHFRELSEEAKKLQYEGKIAHFESNREEYIKFLAEIFRSKEFKNAILGAAMELYFNSFKGENNLEVFYYENTFTLDNLFFGKKQALDLVLEYLKNIGTNTNIDELFIKGISVLDIITTTQDSIVRANKHSTIKHNSTAKLSPSIPPFLFRLTSDEKCVYEELYRAEWSGKVKMIKQKIILEKNDDKKNKTSKILSMLEGSLRCLDNTDKINFFDSFYINNLATLNLTDKQVNKFVAESYPLFIDKILEWIKLNQSEDAEYFLKPVDKIENHQETDIYMLTLQELIDIKNPSSEVQEQIETILDDIYMEFESIVSKENYNGDFTIAFELLSKKHAYPFVASGELSKLAQNMLDKIAANKLQADESAEIVNDTKLNVFWSKSVAGALAQIKINRPIHYNKAFELFRTITKVGSIQSFISEVNSQDSQVLRFGGHKYKGYEDQYIFDIGEADRAIIHTKTGQVLFVGNPDYH